MDTSQIVIEDTILAACELWLGSAVNQGKVVKMFNEAFKHEEAKVALDKLKADGLVENMQKHNHGEKYFEDLVKVCATLSCENKVPKVAYGKAKVTTLRSDEAIAPYEVFIANTHLGSTPDLLKCSWIEVKSEFVNLIRYLNHSVLTVSNQSS